MLPTASIVPVSGLSAYPSGRDTLGGRASLWRRSSRYQRVRASRTWKAKGRDDPEDTTEESRTGVLQNLFNLGSGTQRLKVSEQDSGQSQNPRTQPGRGTQRLQKQGPGGALQRLGQATRKDPNTVFVAGATGRLGSRIVRQLLLAGIKVRAGARNTAKAKKYTDLAISLGALPESAAKQLQIVPVDLEDEESIAAAIGNASKVVQAVGAAENNILDFGAPKRIDGDGAINLVEAAAAVGVEQYVMVTSLGTGKFGWPAGALNLFGGILVQKRRAEKSLEDSGLQYVIVRPGGMERPTDDYKKANNVRLDTRDQLFGGQVSRLQVAELVAAAVANPDLAENKVIEVVAEAEAPRLEYEVLLQQHPSEVSQEERIRQRERAEESRTRIEAAQLELDDADEARKEAQQIVQQLQSELDAKKSAVRQVEKEVRPLLKEAQELEAQLTRLRTEVEESRNREEAAKAVLSAARGAQREGKVLSAEEFKSIQASKAGAPVQEKAVPQPPQEDPKKKKQLWGFLDRQQKALAEEIPKKEISLKLGTAGPQPSQSEKRVAEGVAQKEIAIGTKKAAKITAEPSIPQGSSTSRKVEQSPNDAGAGLAQPVSAQKKKQQTPEEVESLRTSRQKSAETLAKREADFLGKMEAERKQAAAQRTAEANKRAEDARAKAAELRKAQTERQEAERAKAEVREREQQSARNTAAATALEAEQNAKEARAWIHAWRKEQSSPAEGSSVMSGKDPTSSGNGSTPVASGKAASVGGDQQLPENVKEAREWIREWRARTLENKLPANSSARR